MRKSTKNVLSFTILILFGLMMSNLAMSQEVIINKSDKVKFAEEKAAEKAEYAEKYGRPDQKTPKRQINYPDDFPKFIDTGNPEADKKAWVEARKKWIEDNPERYLQIFPNEKLPAKENAGKEQTPQTTK